MKPKKTKKKRGVATNRKKASQGKKAKVKRVVATAKKRASGAARRASGTTRVAVAKKRPLKKVHSKLKAQVRKASPKSRSAVRTLNKPLTGGLLQRQKQARRQSALSTTLRRTGKIIGRK